MKRGAFLKGAMAGMGALEPLRGGWRRPDVALLGVGDWWIFHPINTEYPIGCTICGRFTSTATRLRFICT